MSKTKATPGDALKRKRGENDTTITKVVKTTTSPSLEGDVETKHGMKSSVIKKLPPFSETGDVNEAIGHMDNVLLSDYFGKQIKRHLGDLRTVELDEKYIPSTAFLNTSEFVPSRNLTTLPSYVETFTLGGEDEVKGTTGATSSPHTLFVASSGIRAAHVTRSLRVFQSDKAAVAKLFAKHIKLADSIDYVKKTQIGFGVGTPTRIQDLIKCDALKTDNLKRIVIDGSYLDQKKRSIFDMKEIFVPLLDFLSQQKLKKRYKEGTLQVLVF